MLSDRIGRLWTMCIIFLFQAGLMMVLRTGLTDMTAFVIVSMLLGFNYGACLSVFPSAVKDNFGLKNFGINYGLVFTAWGVGGFVFPFLAGKIFEAAKKATRDRQLQQCIPHGGRGAGSGGRPDLRHARDRETPQGRHRPVGAERDYQSISLISFEFNEGCRSVSVVEFFTQYCIGLIEEKGAHGCSLRI